MLYDLLDRVIGGVLSRCHADGWHPVAYYSKTMSGPETRYEIYDKNMSAIVRALEE